MPRYSPLCSLLLAAIGPAFIASAFVVSTSVAFAANDPPAATDEKVNDEKINEKKAAEKPSEPAKPDEKKAPQKKQEAKPTTNGKAKPGKPLLLVLDEPTKEVLTRGTPKNVADLKLIQEQLQRVVQHATPATVAVQVGGSSGSAVIISPDGLVLTAGHVVGKPKQPVVFIFADGRRVKGVTLGMNREIDSGMMKITDPGPWPYVKIAKSKNIRAGEWVVAIGHPGGYDGKRSPPVRLGRVLMVDKNVINTDCTLVGGDSGGPLFNMQGEVIGIHSRIGRRITDNFHVPISTYHDTWDRLAASERWGGALGSSEPVQARPLLGVAGNPRGERCEITQVFPGMPAARGGLRVGDVIRKFNGKGVDSFDQLSQLVLAGKPGKKVKIEVLRGSKKMELQIVLGRTQRPLPGSPDRPNSEKKDS